jgi:hypothetical protein
MSRRINVNPGQYKVAGRERQGEQIVHEAEKSRARRLDAPPAPPPKAARRSVSTANPRSRRAK